MTCHFFGPESAIFTGYAAARLLGAGSAEVPCPGRSEYAWGTARAQTGVPVPMCRPARYRPEREPEPVLLWQRRAASRRAMLLQLRTK